MGYNTKEKGEGSKEQLTLIVEVALGVYNIGNSRSVTINQIAKNTLELMRKNLRPVHHKLRPGDPRHTLASISKAKSFDYEPKYSLEVGLKETVRWFSNEG